MVDISHVRGFLERYEATRQSFLEEDAARFRDAFSRIADGLDAIRQRHSEEQRENAPDYNIFRDLGITHYEVETHSAMLANLLNPRQSHGQGGLFLEAFLRLMKGKLSPTTWESFPMPEGDISRAEWSVRTEQPAGGGWVDICLTCKALGYRITIENKVEAGEQPDQLVRYWKWMALGSKKYPRQALVFLTPEGRPATTANGVPYYCLSYIHDLAPSLRGLLEMGGVKAQSVAIILRQYLDVIENFTERASDGEEGR